MGRYRCIKTILHKTDKRVTRSLSRSSFHLPSTKPCWLWLIQFWILENDRSLFRIILSWIFAKVLSSEIGRKLLKVLYVGLFCLPIMTTFDVFQERGKAKILKQAHRSNKRCAGMAGKQALIRAGDKSYPGTDYRFRLQLPVCNRWALKNALNMINMFHFLFKSFLNRERLTLLWKKVVGTLIQNLNWIGHRHVVN